MNGTDIDLGRLARDLRAAALALDTLARKGVPVEDALLDALALGPRSGAALRRILRRRRGRVAAGIKALEAAGRIRRTREGWTLNP